MYENHVCCLFELFNNPPQLSSLSAQFLFRNVCDYFQRSTFISAKSIMMNLTSSRLPFLFFLLFFIFGAHRCFCQANSRFPIPSDLNQAVSELDKAFSRKAKQKFLSLKEQDLRKVSGIYLFHEWAQHDSTPFVRYYEKEGINNAVSNDRDYLTLLAFHRHLRGMKPDISREMVLIRQRNDSVSKARNERLSFILSADTISGNYIPRDIAECMAELDLIVSLELKDQIKLTPQSELMRFHHSLGSMMRTRWNLWEGSRLKTYLEKEGFQHPDGITQILLRCYHHYLNSPNPVYKSIFSAYLPEYSKMVELINANSRQLEASRSYSETYLEFLKTGKINDFTVYKY